MKRALQFVVLALALSLSLSLAVAVWAQAVPSVTSNAASNGAWIDLGNLGGGSSIATSVSANGEVVAGTSPLPQYPYRGFRWTAAGGIQDLDPNPSDNVQVNANGISADASTIVGSYAHYPECNPNCAFSWTVVGGFEILAPVPNGWYEPTATGVSKDGSVVVGWTGVAYGAGTSWRWTGLTGFVDLGTLPGGANGSQALGVSEDGTVVVGSSYTADDTQHAYRWTKKAGMIDLGLFPGGVYSDAKGASTNGSVVVGTATTDGAYSGVAYRWTMATGKVALPILAGWPNAYATGVSADGKTVVGYTTGGGGGGEAWRWTAATGTQSLNDWLEAVGVNASGVNFHSAYGVTANGNGVVGQLTNGDAYLALVKANKTGAPTFSPKPGKYVGSVTVALSHTSSAASIYYTTDGTTPTTNSTPYTEPIPVSETTTIKAIAIVPNYPQSAVATGKYTIK